MSRKAKIRRRRFGAVCLATAIVMLIAGETALKAKLTGVPLLVYWMTCLILTALAAGAAILDAARVRHEIKEEQRSLVEETLREIGREKPSRKNPRK